MELMADLNFLLALKTRILWRLSPRVLSASRSSPLSTHGCSNACSAVMRSSGSTVSMLHSRVGSRYQNRPETEPKESSVVIANPLFTEDYRSSRMLTSLA